MECDAVDEKASSKSPTEISLAAFETFDSLYLLEPWPLYSHRSNVYYAGGPRGESPTLAEVKSRIAREIAHPDHCQLCIRANGYVDMTIFQQSSQSQITSDGL